MVDHIWFKSLDIDAKQLTPSNMLRFREDEYFVINILTNVL